MSDRIMQALSADTIRRMRNWARANAGLGSGAVCAMDLDALVTSGYREAMMPTLEGEANDTEAALARVQIRYQQAVRQWWSYEGRSLRWHARKACRLGVTHKTFEIWVCKGHEQLVAELSRITQIWRDKARTNALRHASVYCAQIGVDRSNSPNYDPIQ